MTAGRSPVELLDALDALRAGALSIRQGYPSEPQIVQHETEVEAEWSDGGRSVLAECYGEDVAAWIVASSNAAPALVAALRVVLDKHVPWYEVNGVRHEHTVTKPCWEDDCDCDGEGHEVPACAECRWSDGEQDGYLVWPCPTYRAVAAALTEGGPS